MSRVDVTLGVKNAQFKKGMEQAKGQVKSFRGVANKGFNFGQAAGIGAILIGLNKLTEKYDRIHKLSLRFGVDAEVIQQLGFAAEQNGASMELMAKAMAQANRSGQEASRGLKTYTDQFDALGINVDQFNGLNQKEQFLAVADAVAKASDQNKAMAATQVLLGKSGLELMPLLKQGSEAIREQAESIITLGNEEVAAMARTRDELNKAKTDIVGGVSKVLAAVIIAYGMIVGWSTIAVTKVYDAISTTQGAIKKFLTGNLTAAAENMKAMVRRMKTTKQEMKDVWKDGLSPDAGKAGGSFVGGSSSDDLAIQEQANKLLVERLRLEKELAAVQEKYADRSRTTEEKLAAAKERGMEAYDKYLALEDDQFKNGGNPELDNKVLAAEVEHEKALLKIRELKDKLASEVKASGLKMADEMLDALKEGMEQQLESLKEQESDLVEKRDGASRRADGFTGGVDHLQSIGLGAGGVNYDGNSEAAKSRKLAVDLNKKVDEVREAIKAQELILEEDKF